MDIVEKMLHIKADVSDYIRVDELPLYLKANFELHQMKVADVVCLLAKPKETVNFAALRKQGEKLKALSGLNCVLCFETVTGYVKQKMIAEGIPFIVEGKQVYLPFLGIVLRKEQERVLPETQQLSFMTQKLLLTAIYQHWKQITLTQVADAMGVSKMSVTRYFDELEAMGIQVISRDAKSRCFVWPDSRKALWDSVSPLLRNPVQKEYCLDEAVSHELPILSGMSAICSYSMLSDNAYTTYAITKKTAKEFLPDKERLVPKGEIPAAVVQVMHYLIPYGSGSAVDPLSAILSMSTEEKADPRIGMTIDEILEDVLHD